MVTSNHLSKGVHPGFFLIGELGVAIGSFGRFRAHAMTEAFSNRAGRVGYRLFLRASTPWRLPSNRAP